MIGYVLLKLTLYAGWCFLGVKWLDPAPSTVTGFLIGTGRTSRRWRLGGTLASSVADTRLLIEGIPVGRFLC